METKISKTIRQWFPDSYDLTDSKPEFERNISDYRLLQNLAVNCVSKLNTDTGGDV